jgi:CBS domain containing-hemolysin-like protein
MSNIDLFWIVPVMLLLLVTKGFFSGSEIALVNADKIKLGHAAKQGRRGARLVLDLFRRPERVLTTTLVGTNVATVTLTTLGTLVMIHLLGEEAGDLYAFLVYTPLFLILGEIVPKAIYQEKANAIAPVVVYPLRFFSWLFAPVVFVFSSVARFAAARVGGPATAESLFVGRDQLRAVMEMAERASGTQVFDRFRIERAVRFPDTTVGETMVPAGEMVAIDRGAAIEDATGLVRRTGHSHLPVYEGNVSNVVGTLTLTPWDLLDPALGTRSLGDLSNPATYVSPHQTLEEVAPLLRERDDRMAVVVDEFGSAMGIITMEDIVEAVVGEVEVGFAFEESLAREQRRYEALEDGSYRMDGRLSISEANDVLGLDLPTSEFHTVGGLITSKLRRLAHPGDAVVADGYRFIVEEATERTIRQVRVEPDRLGQATEDRRK